MTRTLPHFIAFLKNQGFTFNTQETQANLFSLEIKIDEVLDRYEEHARGHETADQGRVSDCRARGLCIVIECVEVGFPYCTDHNVP